MTMMTSRSYREVRRIPTFEERFDYLSLGGTVGRSTFGFDRYLNQRFYTSREWRHIRNDVIARDEGCDLGILGYEIHDRVLVHHINPIDVPGIQFAEEDLFDMNNLITTTHRTHNAIHYGDSSLLSKPFTPRERGDTKLW
jgi:hypothetical protein